DRPAGMTSSPRPQPRPQPRPARPTPPVVAEAPAPTPEPTPTPAPAPTPEPTPAPSPEPSAADNAAADILAALSEQAAPATPAAPAGPPLSAGERESLRVAVQQCWNVDIGAEWANVIVTVAMSMNPDGTVQANSLRMISAEGGSAGAAEQAFQAARRAILRCQQSGYSLPADKYAHWQNIEMTFNPERMRLR
ncbi:MAG: energy transducer TonB, partial [Paracoccaceae bacterium]